MKGTAKSSRVGTVLSGSPDAPVRAAATASDMVLAWIATLPLDQRRSVLVRARTLPKIDAVLPNIAATIPANASLEQKAQVLSGYLLDVLALHTADDKASKADIYKLAEALATRLPVQGDPGGTTDMTTAATLAMAREPEAIADAIASGLSPAEVRKMAIELYGDGNGNLPMHGGAIWDTLKKIGGFISSSTTPAAAVSTVADEAAKAAAANAAVVAETAPAPADAATADVLAQAASALADPKATLVTQLEAFKASLHDMTEKLTNQTADFEATKEDLTRAQWALAFLNADAEVVKALGAVTPDMSGVTPAVSSVFALVESLRQNTSLTKFGTLTRALSAMFGKKISGMTEILGGDPGAEWVGRRMLPGHGGLFSGQEDQEISLDDYTTGGAL